MTNLMMQLYRDDAGFIVSAELVLVSTIAVLSMIVGLSEVANAVNQELEDVGSAFGSVNQSYRYSGLTGHKGTSAGSLFDDSIDHCDSQFDIVCDSAPSGEGDHYHYGYGY